MSFSRWICERMLSFSLSFRELYFGCRSQDRFAKGRWVSDIGLVLSVSQHWRTKHVLRQHGPWHTKICSQSHSHRCYCHLDPPAKCHGGRQDLDLWHDVMQLAKCQGLAYELRQTFYDFLSLVWPPHFSMMPRAWITCAGQSKHFRHTADDTSCI